MQITHRFLHQVQESSGWQVPVLDRKFLDSRDGLFHCWTPTAWQILGAHKCWLMRTKADLTFTIAFSSLRGRKLKAVGLKLLLLWHLLHLFYFKTLNIHFTFSLSNPTPNSLNSPIIKRHFRITEGNVPNALARKKKNRKNWSDRYLNYFILLLYNSWEYNDIPLFIIHSTVRFRTTPNYSFLWIFILRSET